MSAYFQHYHFAAGIKYDEMQKPQVEKSERIQSIYVHAYYFIELVIPMIENFAN